MGHVETVDVPDQVDAADIRSGSRVNRSIGVTNVFDIQSVRYRSINDTSMCQHQFQPLMATDSHAIQL